MVALFVPIALPAGGAQVFENTIIMKHSSRGNYISVTNCLLLSQPFPNANPIKSVSLGTPIRVLRTWKSQDGQNWLHINASSKDFLGKSIRGWISI